MRPPSAAGSSPRPHNLVTQPSCASIFSTASSRASSDRIKAASSDPIIAVLSRPNGFLMQQFQSSPLVGDEGNPVAAAGPSAEDPVEDVEHAAAQFIKMAGNVWAGLCEKDPAAAAAYYGYPDALARVDHLIQQGAAEAAKALSVMARSCPSKSGK